LNPWRPFGLVFELRVLDRAQNIDLVCVDGYLEVVVVKLARIKSIQKLAG